MCHDKRHLTGKNKPEWNLECEN